jgi:hypothetical protein
MEWVPRFFQSNWNAWNKQGLERASSTVPSRVGERAYHLQLLDDRPRPPVMLGIGLRLLVHRGWQGGNDIAHLTPGEPRPRGLLRNGQRFDPDRIRQSSIIYVSERAPKGP